MKNLRPANTPEPAPEPAKKPSDPWEAYEQRKKLKPAKVGGLNGWQKVAIVILGVPSALIGGFITLSVLNGVYNSQTPDAEPEPTPEVAALVAEGWEEKEKGIFGQWCSDTNPCPETDTYMDYSWSYMVWCKERPCGDIYAKLNITNEGVVVGWTNDTAYGDIGQKVVLTFQSSTKGQGQIVEFQARE